MPIELSGSLAKLSVNGEEIGDFKKFAFDTDHRTLTEFINSKPGETCQDVIDRAMLLSGYDLQSIAISPDGGNRWRIQYHLTKRKA